MIMAPAPQPAPIVEPRPRRQREAKDVNSEPDVISKLRDIVRTHEAAKVDGMMVDVFSASAATQLYASLNFDNRAKMASLPIRKMMTIVHKIRDQG